MFTEMSLPLLSLPLLILKMVLERMGFLDLFVITNTSAKMAEIVKKLVNFQNYRMQVFMEEDFVFSFRSTTDPSLSESIFLYNEEDQDGDTFHLKIGTVDRVPCEYTDAEDGSLLLYTYWNNTVNRGTEVYNALLETFKIPANEVSLNLEEFKLDNFQNLINWINDMFPDVYTLRIMGKCSRQDYVWILKNVKAKQVVLFEMESPEDPWDREEFEVVDLEMDMIEIRHGEWVDLKHLDAIEARSILIDNASLIDYQINIFLYNLKQSQEKSKLKHLTIQFNREADFEDLLSELDATEEELSEPENSYNQWSFQMANGEKCTIIYAKYEDEDDDDVANGYEIKFGN